MLQRKKSFLLYYNLKQEINTWWEMTKLFDIVYDFIAFFGEFIEYELNSN